MTWPLSAPDPPGCSTAITLAQRGLQVALIDRAVFPRDKVCGDFLNPINWPVLQELNVAEDLFSVPTYQSFEVSHHRGGRS